MPCHLRYFNVQGYFNSFAYVQNMGISLEKGTLFDIVLSVTDKKQLEDAVKQSETDTKKGSLPGVVQLIQLVEQLWDKYNVQHDHTHDTTDIVQDMAKRPDLVKKYHLEELVKTYTHHKQYETTTIKQTKEEKKQA